MTNLQEYVPSLKETEVLDDLSFWMGDRDQLLLLHDENDRVSRNGSDAANFVSCIARFCAPIEDVRRQIQEYERYPDYLAEMKQADVRDRTPDETLVDYEFTVETPVYNPTFEYCLRYRETNQGNLLFEAVDGDFPNVLGRWEFVEQGNQTLVIYTVWYDMSNPGWTLSTIFWAQPDYRIALPVTRTAVEFEQLRRGITGRSVEEPDGPENLPDAPEVPLFRGTSFPEESFRTLAEDGILLHVHPNQWVREGDHVLDFRFVTAIGLIEQSADRTRELLTRFSRWSEFIDQVASVDARETEDGYEATWHLDLGVRLLPINFQYTLRYRWEDDYSLPFRLVEGDLRYVYGGLEWVSVGDHRTLYFYTMTTQIGDKDSTLVKLGRLLPHFQIFVGVATGALAVRRMVAWANESS